jgi:hypothetical protein
LNERAAGRLVSAIAVKEKSHRRKMGANAQSLGNVKNI